MQISFLSIKSKSCSQQTLKVLLLTVSLGSIVGCQSVETSTESMFNLGRNDHPISANLSYRHQLNMQTDSYQQLFSEGTNQDKKAKTTLLNALSQHLNSNHVVVSQTRMHEAPFLTTESVDVNSQNAFMSILEGSLSALDLFKLREMASDKGQYDREDADNDTNEEDNDYEKETHNEDETENHEVSPLHYADKNSYAGSAYRLEDDYLLEHSKLYLNYIDEQQDRLPEPDYKITRVEGLSFDSFDNTSLIIDHIDDLYECVVDYSYDLDNILEENNATAADDAQITALQKEYSDCLSYMKEAEPDLLKFANVYQRQYLKRENACIDHFDKQTLDYLNSDRTADATLDHYYNIWDSYSACDLSVHYLKDLEPVTYLMYGWPQYFIDYKQQRVQCADKMIAAQDESERKGTTYKNNHDHYLQIQTEFEQCELQALITKTEYEIKHDLIDDRHYDTDYDSYDYADAEEYEKQQNLEALQEAVEMMQITPAQIAANNFYYYQYLTLNQLSVYDSKQKKYNSVYSFDYVSPSSYTSIKLPLGIHFKQGEIILDPRALMPIFALMSPKTAPLPEEMLVDNVRTTTLAFGLPKDMQRNIPPEVMYDALIAAIGYSLTELDSSNFTTTDVRQDAFAKNLGAHTAIKVNMDAYQSGKMLGVIVKHMINTLKAHVEAHPEAYDEPDVVVSRLESLQELGTKYLTDDVGRALQALESFLPITFNKVNHFYLDADNQLIGKQVSTAIGSDIAGRTHTHVTQIRYDTKSFSQNSLQPLFQQTFGIPFVENSNRKSIDGNAWIHKNKAHKHFLEQAESIRYEYGRYNRETKRFEALENIKEERMAITNDDEYRQPVIDNVDCGSVDGGVLKDESDRNENSEKAY